MTARQVLSDATLSLTELAQQAASKRLNDEIRSKLVSALATMNRQGAYRCLEGAGTAAGCAQ